MYPNAEDMYMYEFPIYGNRMYEADQAAYAKRNDSYGSDYMSRPTDYSSTNIFDLQNEAQKNFSYIDNYGFI